MRNFDNKLLLKKALFSRTHTCLAAILPLDSE